jgi:hypothetical protein
MEIGYMKGTKSTKVLEVPSFAEGYGGRGGREKLNYNYYDRRIHLLSNV